MNARTQGSQRSDTELMQLTRAGDREAYAELWVRYRLDGLRVSRSFSARFDAEDVVSEAFTLVFAALQSGKGPEDNFFAYLSTTIRNLISRKALGDRESNVDDIESVVEREQIPDFSDAADERLVLRKAFASLPERWQQALWYSDVAEKKASEFSSVLGLTPNAASAVTYRAREGLKRAWISANLDHRNAGPECHNAVRNMAALQRDGLRAEDRARVLSHIAGCAQCAKVERDAGRLSGQLRSALFPVALASGSAASALWLLDDGAAAQAVSAQTTPALSPSAKLSFSSISSALRSSKLLAGLAASVVVASSAVVIVNISGEPEANTVTGAAEETTRGPLDSGAAAGGTAGEEAVAFGEGSPLGPEAVGVHDEVEGVYGLHNLESISTSTAAQEHLPRPPEFTTIPGTRFSAPAAVFEGTADPGAEVTLVYTGAKAAGRAQQVVADASGVWSVRVPVAREGNHTAYAFQRDASGQRSRITSAGFPVVWGAAGDAPRIETIDTANGTLLPIVTGFARPGSLVQLALNGRVTGVFAAADGSWKAQPSAGAIAGDNTLVVTQLSLFDVSSISAAVTTEFSLSAPVATLIEDGSGRLSLRVTSIPDQHIRVHEERQEFSHVMAQTTGDDVLQLVLGMKTGLDPADLSLRASYVSADGIRSGPMSAPAKKG